MADRSGSAIDEPVTTPTERLGQGVQAATKPECLGAGGSLLSALVIAYQVATDRCRTR